MSDNVNKNIKDIKEVPDPVEVGGESVNKRMRESPVTAPSPKKRNVAATEGDAPDGAAPSSLGNADQQNPRSVQDEGGEQVQPGANDPEEVAPVADDLEGEPGVVSSLTESESKAQLQDLPAQTQSLACNPDGPEEALVPEGAVRLRAKSPKRNHVGDVLFSDEDDWQVQPDAYDPSDPPNGHWEEIAPVSEDQDGDYHLSPSSPSIGSPLQKLNVVFAQDSSVKTLVLVDKVSSHPKEELAEGVPGDLNKAKASFQPQEEMLELNWTDVPPIEISSDESDNEAADGGDIDVLIILDSEDEPEESSAGTEQEQSFAGEEQDEYFAGEEQKECFPGEEQDEYFASEEQVECFAGEEQENPESYQNSVDAADYQLDLTIAENRRKLARLTALRPLVRLSREMTARASDFEVLCLIGVGAFGRVFVVRKLRGFDAGQVYAMKALSKLAAVHNLQTAKFLKNEREILEAVQGTPFVVCLQYAFHDSRYLYLVMNFAQGGELHRRVLTLGRLPMPDVILYAGEVVLALEYLHGHNIVYRDLKLENILIDSEGHIVLADLGLATVLTAQNQFRAFSFCGTLQYMAPEVVEPRPEGYGKAVDWWSLGVIIVEMLTAISPFTSPNLPSDQQVANTERRILHEEPQIPAWLCPRAVDLVKRLLDKDPSRRLDAGQIREHPFFQDMDWTRLWERRYRMPFRPRLNASDDVQYFDPEITKQPAVVPDREPLPPGLKVYRGFEYTSQQIIEWLRLLRDGSVEYRNPDVERLSETSVPEGLVLVRQLHRGGFGTCFLTDQNLMVKVIHSSKFHSGEVDALSSLDHPNIVYYYGSYRHKTQIWIVTEYLSGGNLKWWIDNFLLNERVSRDIFEQLASALAYVHSNHFIHGDLKPENVVCADSNPLQFKVVDFGNASYSSAFTQWEGPARYSLDYAPPELVSSCGKAVYSQAVDVYGLGATLYCMVVGHPPFRQGVPDAMDSPESREQLRANIGRAAFNESSEKWLTASQEFRQLVAACLARDPADRPRMGEITSCEWMESGFHERRAAAVVGVQVQIEVQEVEANVEGQDAPGSQSHVEENAAPYLIARRHSVA